MSTKLVLTIISKHFGVFDIFPFPDWPTEAVFAVSDIVVVGPYCQNRSRRIGFFENLVFERVWVTFIAER